MHFTSSCFEGLTLMVSDTFVLNHFHFLNIVLRTEAERNPICSVLTKRLGKMQWNNMTELRSWPIWFYSWPICMKSILNGLINIMKCQMCDKEDTKPGNNGKLKAGPNAFESLFKDPHESSGCFIQPKAFFIYCTVYWLNRESLHLMLKGC